MFKFLDNLRPKGLKWYWKILLVAIGIGAIKVHDYVEFNTLWGTTLLLMAEFTIVVAVIWILNQKNVSEINFPVLSNGKAKRVTSYKDKADIKVEFNPRRGGWMEISFSSPLGSYTLNASSTRPPFQEIIRFLEDISNGKLPSSFYFYEEGVRKRFLAQASTTPNLLTFSIETVGGDVGALSDNTNFQGTFSRKQFVGEFYKKYANFLMTDYNKDDWPDHVTKMEPSSLEKYLNEN